MHGKAFAVRARLHARQHVTGKEFDGKGDVAVRMATLHGKGLCRASDSLPCVQRVAVRRAFAVRLGGCRASRHCRALCRTEMPPFPVVSYTTAWQCPKQT
jgi:hypothetical protein